MGCEQSSQKKTASPKWTSKVLPRNPEIDEEYRKEYNNSYQDVLDGQPKVSTMDPEKAEELLKEYVSSEEKISSMERDDPLTLFYIKKSHMESVDEAIKLQMNIIATINAKIGEGERKGPGKHLATVKNILVDIGEKRASKEEQELLAVINKMEIAMTELEMLHQEKAMTESDVNDLQDILRVLKDEYQLQDDILEQLSMNGPSEEEVRLQNEGAELESRRIKLSEVYERWKEGRALVGEACRQFAMALNKWKNIKDDTPESQCDYGEEIRDDLVTALQCLTNAKFYIKTPFPYCSKVEIAILEKAMAYLFIDMKTDERRLHAEGCYNAFQKRTVALYAWMDMTIQVVIDADVKEATKAINEKIKELRLVRQKFFQQHFPTVAWKESEFLLPPKDENATAAYSLSDPESEKVLRELDMSQLAPLPTREEIYGNSVDEMVENYKNRLRDSINENQERKSSKANVLDELIKSRRESLSDNGIIDEEQIALT